MTADSTAASNADSGWVTAGQARLLAAMPELADCHYPEVRDSIPARNYIDPARFDAEIAHVFKGRPVIAAPAAVLDKPRSYFQVTIAGMPILLTRNKDGAIKAFANVCKHRGMKLCTAAQTQHGPRIVCPYHAWTFDLDGKLIGLPRAETFPGLDKAQLGLTELPARVAGGLVWVGLDPDNPPDFSDVTGELAEDFTAMGMADAFCFDHTSFPVKANWKLVMDSMLDSYHVTRLHAQSLGNMFVDRKVTCEQVGEHMRVMSGRAGFHQGENVETFEQFRESAVVHYTLVPGALIITSPTYISVMLLSPQAVDKTVVHFYLLVDRLPETEREIKHYDKALALMARITTQEDFWVAELGTIAARAGVVKELTCGGMEREIVQFHKNVNAILGV